MPLNNFLPFAIGAGANVESQSSYAVDPLLPIGNQPGIAVSAANNKVLRQGTVIASQIAQFMANKTGTDILDDTNMTKLLAQMFSAFDRKTPVFTTHLAAGSGTHNLSYKFQVASANATIGATYSDGTTVFTVSSTIAAGLELVATGAAAPIVSGVLTKTSGTGDTTITFFAVRAPIYMRIRAVGAGGGGGGSGTGNTGGQGTPAGGNTVFGTSLIVAPGGGGAGNTFGQTYPSLGGNPTVNSPAVPLVSLNGMGGMGTFNNGTNQPGGAGGISPFGGAGGGAATSSASAAIANSGSGGGGAGGPTSGTGGAGIGGASGSYAETVINSPASSYTFTVGAGGSGGAAGTNGAAGAAGATGAIIIEEHYQ